MDKGKLIILVIVAILLLYILTVGIKPWPAEKDFIKEGFSKEISLFNTYCIQCHIDDNDYRAPSLKNGQWPLLWKDLDAAHLRVIEGYKGMPPRGDCKNCSDEELFQILEYIKAYQEGI